MGKGHIFKLYINLFKIFGLYKMRKENIYKIIKWFMYFILLQFNFYFFGFLNRKKFDLVTIIYRINKKRLFYLSFRKKILLKIIEFFFLKNLNLFFFFEERNIDILFILCFFLNLFKDLCWFINHFFLKFGYLKQIFFDYIQYIFIENKMKIKFYLRKIGSLFLRFTFSKIFTIFYTFFKDKIIILKNYYMILTNLNKNKI